MVSGRFRGAWRFAGLVKGKRSELYLTCSTSLKHVVYREGSLTQGLDGIGETGPINLSKASGNAL